MMSIQRVSLVACAACAAALLFCSPASHAAIIVTSGNNPGDTENIEFDPQPDGLAVIGETNQTATPFEFESPTQILTTPSSGQARIEAIANASQVEINDSITITPVESAILFDTLIFNAFIGGGLGSNGALQIDVDYFDSLGAPQMTTISVDDMSAALSLSNGENFYTVTSTDGDLLRSITITPTSGDYADLRQVRVGGIVPEPSTWALLAGGVAALATIRRRRR